ncbi:MAG: phenylalanine--tRNA ligase beta subunit-related protein [Thaumarchaeota archaeon]|nr:phenylalanine--tRNA ligase beta subunit-related protein [Nitrososphaerota archaeon]
MLNSSGKSLTIDEALQKSFPGLEVIELRIEGISVKERDESLEAFKPFVQQKVRGIFGSLEQIRDHSIFRTYRDFFWRVGIDPTKTRPASEALTRRIIGGKDLPTINTLVDAYNLASVETSVAIAAFDLGSISGTDLFMRKATMGERFLGIGMKSEMSLTGIEVVIEDLGTNRLIAIYPYRDSDDSKVTLQTREVLLMMCGVPGLPRETLVEAEKLSREFVTRFCSNQ